MRILVLGVFLVVAACTKPNPNVCCVTPLQCDALGVDEPRPCDVGQACRAGGCVAAECQAAADCSADSPICSNNLCVGTCQIDDDCAEVAGRNRCSAQGTCVGCLDASQCPPTASICDGTGHVCRGCELDNECASGVCLEISGVCAEEQALVYVSTAGTDAGTCTKGSPCATIPFALLKVSPTRPVLRLLGSLFEVSNTVSIDRSVILDANGTRVNSTTSPAAPIANIQGVVVVDMEGLVLGGQLPMPAVTVGSGATLRVKGVSLESAGIEVANGSLEVADSKISKGRLGCSGGSISSLRNRFNLGSVRFQTCQTTVLDNRWDPGPDGSVDGNGGLLKVENNVFVVPSEFADLIRVFSLAPGSLLAFNTIVNTSNVVQSPIAISCDATLMVSSNIIAYNSPNPLAMGCVAQLTLFDLLGGPDAPGNPSGDAGTFFLDRAGGDFHLAPSSPARGIGKTGIVTTDHDGKPRPEPAGSLPDVGAFEAP